jgi:hypothetical protein
VLCWLAGWALPQPGSKQVALEASLCVECDALATLATLASLVDPPPALAKLTQASSPAVAHELHAGVHCTSYDWQSGLNATNGVERCAWCFAAVEVAMPAQRIVRIEK